MNKNPYLMPYDCFKGETTLEQIKVFWTQYNGYDEPMLTQTILREMESDKEDESERILALYSMVDERERALLDYLLVALCGWTLSSLMMKNQESKLSPDKLLNLS